jgi:hypothetical protein
MRFLVGNNAKRLIVIFNEMLSKIIKKKRIDVASRTTYFLRTPANHLGSNLARAANAEKHQDWRCRLGSARTRRQLSA